MAKPRRPRGEGDEAMAARLKDLYDQARAKEASLPELDPNAEDFLERLFAWGTAFRKAYNLTDEELREIEARVESQTRKRPRRP